MKINSGKYGSYLSIDELKDKYLGGNPGSDVRATDGRSFADILSDMTASGGVRFSKHASQRLESRNIDLSASQLERLNEAVSRAGRKGVKDSLVLVDNLAFIVNTKSSTVVTAMDASDTKNSVFSNIDGAVIA